MVHSGEEGNRPGCRRARPVAERLLSCAFPRSSGDNVAAVPYAPATPQGWGGVCTALPPVIPSAPSGAIAKGESGSSERSRALAKATQQESRGAGIPPSLSDSSQAPSPVPASLQGSCIPLGT